MTDGIAEGFGEIKAILDSHTLLLDELCDRLSASNRPITKLELTGRARLTSVGPLIGIVLLLAVSAG